MTLLSEHSLVILLCLLLPVAATAGALLAPVVAAHRRKIRLQKVLARVKSGAEGLPDADNPKAAASEPAAHRPVILTVERFEKVLIGKKMYLDPELKMNDLLRPLCTNRTYLSNFINRTYGMGFRRLVNVLRMQEIAHLERHERHGGNARPAACAIGAGFGSYRNYQRARHLAEYDADIINRMRATHANASPS